MKFGTFSKMNPTKSFVLTLLFAVVIAVDYRLETNIVPNSYKIAIQPYIRSEDGDKQFTFNGTVEINVNVIKSDVKEIIVHTKNLEVSEAEVSYNNIVQTIDGSHTYYDITNKFTIHLRDALTVGYSYTIRMSFKGQMDDDLHGFYRSSYINPNGEIR